MAVDLPPGLLPANNLSDVLDPVASRVNLGIRSMGTYDAGTGFTTAATTVSVTYGSSASSAARGDLAEFLSNKNAPLGYAGLDNTGRIPPALLPASLVGGALLAANNLSDLTSPSIARASLGLGTMATQNASNITLSGGAIDNTTIGVNIPVAGHFTSLTANSPPTNDNSQNVATTSWTRSIVGSSYSPNSVTITGGTIDNTVIGSITSAIGHFTTLTANTPSNSDNSGNVATTAWVTHFVSASGVYNPANVSISGGTIDGTTIGQNVASTGIFTTLSAGTLLLSGTISNNFVLAGASSGPAVHPTFRSLVPADLPPATTSTGGIVIVGTGLAVTASTVSVIYGTSANTATQGNDSRIAGALQATNNLSDVTSSTTARTNLGLGTLATQSANSVLLSGGTINGITIGATTATSGSFTSLNASAAVSLGFAGASGYGISLQGATYEQSLITVTPSSGFSLVIPNNCSFYQLNPAGTLASGTLTMPGGTIANGQIIRIVTSQTISALTISANTGQVISNPPSAALAGTSVNFIYSSSNSTWYNYTARSPVATILSGTIDNTVIGGNIAAAATFTTISLTSTQSANTFLAAPSSGSGAPSWRSIAAADLPLATTSVRGSVIVGIGLGVSAGTVSVSYGTIANTSVQGNDVRVTNALQSTNNLSDITNIATSRTNLGLGNLATQNASSIVLTGGTIDGIVIGSITPSTATFTGIAVGGNAVTSSSVVLNSTAGYSRNISFQSGGVARWNTSADGVAESFTSLTTTGAVSSGNVLTFASTSGVLAGMRVSGTNIASGSTVTTTTTTTVTLSASILGNIPSGTTIQFQTLSGSNYTVTAYDDYGNLTGNYLRIARATGIWSLGSPNAAGVVATPVKLVFPSEYVSTGTGLKLDLYNGTYGIGITNTVLNLVSAGSYNFTGTGGVTMANVAITGGTMDSVTVGSTTAGSGRFTTLTANTPSASDSSTNVATTAWVVAYVSTGGTYTPSNVAITGGTINGTTIGGTTPAAATFTTLTLTGAIAANLFRAGPASGAPAAPGWRVIATSDLPIATTAAVGAVSISTGLNVSAGGAVTVSYGTSSGTATQGNDTRVVNALQNSNNLSELTNTTTARTNLGLGSIATQSAAAVAITGGTINSTSLGATTAAAATVTTLAVTGSLTASYVLAAPTASAGSPTWRQLTSADVSGVAPLASPTFTGTVTIPGGTINNTAIGGTTAAAATFTTLALTSAQTASYVLAAPAGAAGAPGWRQLSSGDITGVAPLASPALTGTPTAPTAAAGANSTQVSTTAFVYNSINSPLTITTTGGSTTLTAAQYGSIALLVTGTLTSNATLVVPATGFWSIFNRTTGTFSLTVKTATGTGIAIDQGYSVPLVADGTNVVIGHTDFNSVSLLGVSTAATANVGTNNSQIATTAFVVTSFAPLASPALTGTPTAPTAAANTNTTQLATTAYVLGQASSVTPGMNSTAAAGTSTTFSRSDHIHPTDTSRAPLASPALTGTPTAPTATSTDNSTTLATTAFVKTSQVNRKIAITLQWTGGAVVANGTYYFTFNAPIPGTFNSLDYVTGNGSFTANIQIAGTSITGLSAVTVNNTTSANTAATGSNTFTSGQQIAVVITNSTSNPTGAVLNMNATPS